ncbi:unnamed protein product [Ectocarpus sp. CCAP 1310/34]|nr:unnamed protein product [Ectocarpus sp. CCAP 1310/34]
MARAPASRRSWLRGKTKKRMRQLLELLMIMVLMDEGDPPQTRDKFVRRERRSWYTYAKPMVQDGTFRLRFRMDYTEFALLADMLRPKLERNERMGALRNGVIPVEFQLAMALRFLAGGSVFEVMDGNVIARSTAYAIVHRVIDAINQTRELDCVWPEGEDALDQCGMYRRRSTNGVIRMCVGAMDGLFVRMTQPSLRRHVNPRSFYSGHKKGFGMNFQGVCNARYEIIAWTMNCPGSCNDRTAFKHSVFGTVLKTLPPGAYIVGDAAYPASDQVLVPYPGTSLTRSQDAYNFYQSQARISIEQAFGIMVKTWGILWRPLDMRLERVSSVINSVVRLHNFLRRRRARIPRSPWRVTQPVEVRFRPDGSLEGTYFDTVPTRGRQTRGGRASAPREAIRQYLEQYSIGRPRWNLQRNSG